MTKRSRGEVGHLAIVQTHRTRSSGESHGWVGPEGNLKLVTEDEILKDEIETQE